MGRNVSTSSVGAKYISPEELQMFLDGSSKKHDKQALPPALRLPQEVLDEIYRHVSTVDAAGTAERVDTAKLSMVSMTCKALRQSTESALYSNIAVRGEQYPYVAEEWDEVNFSHDHPQIRTLRSAMALECLLRTLLERRELCKHIKTIALPSTSTSELRFRGESVVDENRCPSWMFNPNQLAFRFAIEEGEEDAETALLLGLAHDLKDLKLVVPRFDGAYNGWFRRLVRLATAPPSLTASSMRPLQSLEHLHILTHTREQGHRNIKLRELNEMLQLSGLKSLTATFHVIAGPRPGQRNSDGTIERGPERILRSSSIKTVLLQDCTFDDPDGPLTVLDVFQWFMESFQDLESFGLTYVQDPDYNFLCMSAWPGVVHCLTHSSKTLRSFTLTANKEVLPKEVVDDYFAPQPLPTLRHFENLRHICVQQKIVTGSPRPLLSVFSPFSNRRQLVDLLPESIEALTISDCTPYYLHFGLLEALLEEIQGGRRCGRLSKLTTMLSERSDTGVFPSKALLEDPGRLDDFEGLPIPLVFRKHIGLTSTLDILREVLPFYVGSPVLLPPPQDADPYQPVNFFQTLFDAIPELHNRLTKGFAAAGIIWTHNYRKEAHYGLDVI